MRHNRYDSVCAETSKHTRFEQHSRPDFACAKIIEQRKARLSEDLRGVLGSDLRIVLTRQTRPAAAQSLEGGANGNLFVAADHIKVFRRERFRDQLLHLLE